MVKESEKASAKPSGQPSRKSDVPDKVLVQLCSDDFQRNEDGSWVAVKDIFIADSAENQRLIKEGREFKKGELAIVGLDLAAILEKHCPQ